MTKSTEDTDMNELITAMVGRSLENRFPEVDNTAGRCGFVRAAFIYKIRALS